jgi:hypothetical protein
MVNDRTAMFFPGRFIPELQDLRGERWKELVHTVAGSEAGHPDRLAFILMMVRLGGCAGCHADAYWAVQGCVRCARNTITRFRGPDEELLEKYQAAKEEIRVYLQKST